MSKKIITLLLIMAIVLTLGCTGTGQPSATPDAVTTTPAADTGINPTTAALPSPVNATPADNESIPEMDLPLPPDLSDL